MDSAQNRGAHLFGKSAKNGSLKKVSSLETQEMSSVGTQEMSCHETQDMGHPSDTLLCVTPVTQNR